MDAVSLGHGAALHFPDLPWACWGYTNWRGEPVSRDNLSRFLQAAHMACKAVQAFVRGNPRYEAEPGLSAEAQRALSSIWLRCRDTDGGRRLASLAQALQAGEIPGLAEAMPAYVGKGVGSWKQLATGIAAADDGELPPAWSPEFERSDYRKFHDALKQHRQVVTQEILPASQIRLV